MTSQHMISEKALEDMLEMTQCYSDSYESFSDTDSIESDIPTNNYSLIEGNKFYSKQNESFALKGSFGMKYGNYKFSRIESVESFINTCAKSNDPMYYELCYKNVKMFADLENYFGTDYDMTQNFNILLADIFNRLDMEFDESNCTYLVDSSQSKKSMHFIYNNNKVFKYNRRKDGDQSEKYSQYEFWSYVENILKKEDKYKYFEHWCLESGSNGEDVYIRKFAIDFSVYSAHRAMRVMHSKKSGNDRTFYPCTIDHKKKELKLLKRQKIMSEHIINSPNNDHYYNLDIKSINSIKYTRHYKTDVDKIILSKISDVRITEVKDNLIKLRNVKKRNCLIGGIIHKVGENNSYCVIRKDGIYFHCLDTDCTENPLDDIILNDKGDLKIHTFDDPKKSLLAKLVLDEYNDKVIKPRKIRSDDLVYSDFKKIMRKFKTETISVKTNNISKDVIVLTKESRQQLEIWVKSVFVYIDNNSRPYYLVKTKNVDPDTDIESIEWMPRNIKEIQENPRSIQKNRAALSVNQLKIISQGQYLKYATLYNIIPDYNNHTFYPYSGKKKNLPETFNVFEGFYIENSLKNEEVKRDDIEQIEIDEDDFEKSIQYKHIVENICNGDKELANWHLNYLAHLVQKPSEKPGVCLVLYSLGGAGKDMHCEWISNMIGNEFYAVYGDLDSYLSKFNYLNCNKLLCVFNEVDDKKSKKNHEIVKHIITQKKERIEVKFMSAFNIPEYKRFIINTNHRDTIRIENSDRRYVMYEMNAKQIGDFEFFSQMAAEMKNPQHLRCAFKYFQSRDISEFNIRKIPNTQYKKKQRMLSLISTNQFLINMQHIDSPDSEYTKKLYRHAKNPDIDPNLNAEYKAEKIIFDMLTPSKEKYDFEFQITDLYNLYKDFCIDNNLRARGKSTFKQDLESLNLGTGRDRKINFKCRAYIHKRSYGYTIDNKLLKKSLEDKLNISL